MKSFTSKPKMEPVTIDGDEYALVELTGKARDKYMQGMSGRMRYNSAGKPVGLKNFDGLQANLLVKVLHHATHGPPDEEGGDPTITEVGDAVTMNVIQDWGSGTQTELFEMAQELCGMGDDEEEAAKND
jgi:hypothetical protein